MLKEDVTNKNGLSALVITFNEEKNIEKVIENLAFADEIIIVDSFSTDATYQLATKQEKVKIWQREFVNFADQRNYALSLATHPWILFIDADEYVSDTLQIEIRKTIQKESPIVAYQCYRTFFFQNKALYFSGWQTDKIFRLFKKEFAYYNPKKIVHEKLLINGPVGTLQNKICHYSYANFTTYKNKMAQYGKLKALEELEKGTRPNVYHFYIRPIYQFLYQYLLRLGILDGQNGLIICYLNAYSVYVRFQELKQLNSKSITFSRT
jgi:glycosyltransferase involved in cell wall biosynthesis